MFRGKIHYGWVIVVASFCLIFLDGLLLYTFGVFKPHLSGGLDLSETAVSSIFSLRCVALAVSMPLAGKLAEKYDPRWIIVSGGVIVSTGVFLAGSADSVGEIYLYYGVLVGLGDGAFYTLPVSIISRWFRKNRALAIGIATTGVPVSGLFMSPLSAWLINSYGLRDAFFIIAAMVFVISLWGLLLRKDPAEMGKTPVGDGLESVRADADLNSTRAVDALKQGDFWVLYFIFWAGFNTFLIVVINLYDFSVHSGLNILRAAVPPALVGVGSIFGRIFFSGYVTRFFEEKRVLFFCYIFQAATILPILFFGDIWWALYIFGFMFGFFYSGWVPMFPTILGKLYGLRELGTIFGFFGSGFSLAALTGPITAGLLLDSFGYSHLFLAAAIFCACAAAMTFFVNSAPATAHGGNS